MEAVAVALLFVVFVASYMQACLGALYRVGDSKGWTAMGDINYTQWAETKHFQVGDVIQFVYNPHYHNVMVVTDAAYGSCDSSSPVSTYTSGNDSILLHTPGHYLYICGVVGHCQKGQKVDINVMAQAPALSNVPSLNVMNGLSFKLVAPAPAPSNAPSLSVINGFFVMLGVAVSLCTVFISNMF